MTSLKNESNYYKTIAWKWPGRKPVGQRDLNSILRSTTPLLFSHELTIRTCQFHVQLMHSTFFSLVHRSTSFSFTQACSTTDWLQCAGWSLQSATVNAIIVRCWLLPGRHVLRKSDCLQGGPQEDAGYARNETSLEEPHQ